jgi:hypothetical protein
MGVSINLSEILFCDEIYVKAFSFVIIFVKTFPCNIHNNLAGFSFFLFVWIQGRKLRVKARMLSRISSPASWLSLTESWKSATF